MKKTVVGVIDSGVGGLTILKSLICSFPQLDFVYFGDTKHAPYGEKDITLIKDLTEEMIRFMERKNVQILVVACNTITASQALQKISTTIPHKLEIIEPTVLSALSHSTSHHITLLATDVTIQSNLYQSLLKKYKPSISLSTYSLPLLVHLAEKAEFESPQSEALIKDLAHKIPINSTVILGCTHYPFFIHLFKKYFDESVKIVDSSDSTKQQLRKILPKQNSKNAGKYELYTSGDRNYLMEIGERYLL